MKKYTLISALCAILLFTGCGKSAANTVHSSSHSASTPISAEPAIHSQKPVSLDQLSITEEEAVNIALQNAGVTEGEVTRLRVHLSYEAGQVYEVEFYAGDKEYDYDISVKDGSVVSVDYDVEDDLFLRGTEEEDSPILSEQDVLALVLEKVPGATEQSVHIHKDWDDGRKIYEGSLVFENKEYDFEVDAESGVFLEWEVESVFD